MQMALTNRTCGECALMQHNGGTCPIFNQTFEANESGCPRFAKDLVTCELCRHLIMPVGVVVDMTDDEHPHFICDECRKKCGHCPTCVNARTCAFETDPSSLPKLIQKEFRQGNMISVTQVKNPARIDITCKKGCPCFSEENGCSRQINTCGNYKIGYDS